MSDEQKKEAAKTPADRALSAPPRDRMMRRPVERRPANTQEILNGPRRIQKPILETSDEQ